MVYKFRLTEPISSNKIYITQSLKQGANKCLNELYKHNDMIDFFMMVDDDTKEKYAFILNKKETNNKLHKCASEIKYSNTHTLHNLIKIN